MHRDAKIQHRALMELYKDQDILIVPANKGKTKVILNKEEYIQNVRGKGSLMMTQRTISYIGTLDALKRLQQQGYIDDKLRDCLTPCYSNPPQLCNLSKIHKDGVPMHPNVSAVDSPWYRLTMELAQFLSPLAGHNGYTIKNSTAFVEML